MPIYAYKCESCGFSKDVLQKMSDPLLTLCPSCGAESFKKQLTAAGFQLKGSGWYVTDFRGGNTGGKPAEDAAGGDAKPADKGGKADAASDAGTGSSAPSKSSDAAQPTRAATAPASAPSAAPTPAAAAPAPAARKD